jgi:hypothetical protein
MRCDARAAPRGVEDGRPAPLGASARLEGGRA